MSGSCESRSPIEGHFQCVSCHAYALTVSFACAHPMCSACASHRRHCPQCRAPAVEERRPTALLERLRALLDRGKCDRCRRQFDRYCKALREVAQPVDLHQNLAQLVTAHEEGFPTRWHRNVCQGPSEATEELTVGHPSYAACVAEIHRLMIPLPVRRSGTATPRGAFFDEVLDGELSLLSTTDQRPTVFVGAAAEGRPARAATAPPRDGAVVTSPRQHTPRATPASRATGDAVIASAISLDEGTPIVNNTLGPPRDAIESSTVLPSRTAASAHEQQGAGDSHSTPIPTPRHTPSPNIEHAALPSRAVF